MSIISELRSATKEKHGLLDKHKSLSKITSQRVDLDDYKSYLQLFYGIHSCIEPVISSNIDVAFKFEPRLSKLDKELEVLGLSRNYLSPNDPLLLDKDEILGSLYVIEGSKLGGKMIVKHLRKNLTLDNHDYSFLDGASSYSWKDTMDFIEENAKEKAPETITGALKTFDFILSYVDQFYEQKNSQNK